MPVIPLLTLLLAANTGNDIHAPHDSTYSIACAQLNNGSVVTAIVGAEQQILVTRDGGYSWQAVGGDGIQLTNATTISFHSGLSTSLGEGAFIIGTDKGSWLLEPGLNIAFKNNTGLARRDKSFLNLDSPSHGTDGPTVGVTKNGSVYLLDSNTLVWSKVYQSANPLRYATKIAIAPHASTSSAAAGAQDIILAANGQLHISHDLGLSWSISSQFSAPALSIYDWHITSVDFSDDYVVDQTFMLGRGRLNSAGTSDEGEIWASVDSGLTFALKHTLDTAISTLLSTPADPFGKRFWLAAGRQYPNYGTYFGTGILRSEDAGQSWSDNGSLQDFLLEDSPGKKSGAVEMFYFSQLQVAADFSQSGAILYGRQEGLFKSTDSGVHWSQQATRFANRFRDVETAINANGDDIVFGAGYGTGTVMYNAATSQSEIVPVRSPMVYQRRISVSPNYDLDGRLLIAGNVYLYEWQSPDVSPSNPQLAEYWFTPSVRNSAVTGPDTGYPRGVQYSPHFDPTGTVANADQTFFWFTAEGLVRRSSDNGATSERLFETTLGTTTGEVHCVAIAPTYDALTTRTDAYAGTTNGVLYRLLDTQWLELFDFNDQLTKLVVAPNYERPSNPVLFAITKSAPFVFKITDDPGGLSVQVLRHNLNSVSPTGIALHPDFENNAIVYISTKASGVFSLNLGETVPTWTQMGTNIPLSAVDDIALSKNFATDGAAYLATNNDMMLLDSNNSWQNINGVFRLDDTDESISTYSPNNPNVLDPTHVWPWRSTFRWSLPGDLQGTGDEVLFADYDGDYFTCPVRGSKVSLMTFQGPRLGEVELELIDPATGQVVVAQSFDLEESNANIDELVVGLTTPDSTKIYTFKVTADLDPGQMLVIDGVEIELN